jgi:N-acetylglutamate synthase
VAGKNRVVPKLSIRELEAVAALGWQAADRSWLGGWLLRAAEGFTGRANSALPLGDPGLPLPDAVDAVQRWYGDRGLRPTVVVPHPMAGSGGDPFDRLLERRGWVIRPGAAVVMTAAASDVARTGMAPLAGPAGRAGLTGPGGLAGTADVEIADRPSAAWLSCYHYRGHRAPAVAERLLVSAPWQAFAALRQDGEIVAIGRIAVASGWAGLSVIEVAPEYRRRGLATAIIGALGRVAASQGATRVYLQVEDTNDTAQGLYARCGFAPHHRYHYRLGPLVA